MAHRAPGGVGDCRIVLVADEPVRGELADGLRRYGAAVPTGTADGDYGAGFDAAERSIGSLDTVVWAWTNPELMTAASLVDIDAGRWRRLVGDSLRAYVEFLQAAERRLRAGGGRVIVVVPSIALGGAAGLVAWATVAEGQRALAKSVARVWGANRITVNWVAVSAGLLAAAGDELGRPNLQQPALPDPDLGRDVAGVITMLCGAAAASVTGATVGVDGGRWMPS